MDSKQYLSFFVLVQYLKLEAHIFILPARVSGRSSSKAQHLLAGLSELE